MTDSDTKETLILRYETIQAQRLADRVIFKPPLSVWYILIPIIFVFYFFRLNKYAASRKEFVDHYMRSRRRAIEAAAQGVAQGRRPKIDDIVAQTQTPTESMKEYKAYTHILVEHYTDLLKATGSEYDTLLRSAYRTRSNYLLFLNQLGQVEKELDKALSPSLVAEHPAVGETIALIEQQVAQLRRAEAERVFS